MRDLLSTLCLGAVTAKRIHFMCQPQWVRKGSLVFCVENNSDISSWSGGDGFSQDWLVMSVTLCHQERVGGCPCLLHSSTHLMVLISFPTFCSLGREVEFCWGQKGPDPVWQCPFPAACPGPESLHHLSWHTADMSALRPLFFNQQTALSCLGCSRSFSWDRLLLFSILKCPTWSSLPTDTILSLFPMFTISFP